MKQVRQHLYFYGSRVRIRLYNYLKKDVEAVTQWENLQWKRRGSQNNTRRLIPPLFILSEVSVEMVRQTIQSVDPEAPAEVIDKYLGRAFHTAADQLESGTKIETTLLIKRLQSGSVKRLGPKPK